ncbi:MAG TPA: hypothetical protein VGD38_09205, partial [Pyrinomonadaceae bacterium]
NTVKSGETTVVRPVNAGPGRRMLPVALSAVALLVLACGVFGFFMWKKRDRSDVMQVTVPTPTPAASPASAEATPAPSESEDENATPDEDEEETATTTKPAPAPKKQERASREEATPDRRSEDPRVQVEVETHEQEAPDVPTPPNVGPDGVPRLRRPQTRVMPDGRVMRILPDGSQIITMRDGTRIYVAPDGRRTVVPPRDRPNRRTPAPSPSP